MIGLSSIGLKIIRLKTLFIKDKNLRRKQRQLIEQQYIKNLVKKYKWGISYSVFDGEELLEASIKSVRKMLIISMLCIRKILGMAKNLIIIFYLCYKNYKNKN